MPALQGGCEIPAEGAAGCVQAAASLQCWGGIRYQFVRDTKRRAGPHRLALSAPNLQLLGRRLQPGAHAGFAKEGPPVRGQGRASPGAPMPSQALQADQDLQLWKEIDDACSAYLSKDSHPQASSALEELCFLAMGFLQKPQGLDEKDNTKRFLFHYSKTHESGNSDIMSSVLHPLLQLVPQLNERRLKRYKVDEELQGPGGIQSRGYFFFRPRNGRRSADFH
nr:PREDICTED: neuromedin-U [Struthio camelus australis]